MCCTTALNRCLFAIAWRRRHVPVR